MVQNYQIFYFALSTHQQHNNSNSKINCGSRNLRDGVSYIFFYRIKQRQPFACKPFFDAVFCCYLLNAGTILHCDKPIISLTWAPIFLSKYFSCCFSRKRYLYSWKNIVGCYVILDVTLLFHFDLIFFCFVLLLKRFQSVQM